MDRSLIIDPEAFWKVVLRTFNLKMAMEIIGPVPLDFYLTLRQGQSFTAYHKRYTHLHTIRTLVPAAAPFRLWIQLPASFKIC